MTRRKPGTDMNFRRSLPEIRCLSQGLPTAQFASRDRPECPKARLLRRVAGAIWARVCPRVCTINANLGYTYP